MNSLIVYKPLTEAITYTGERYYKSCTPEEFHRFRSDNEALFFDIDKRYVASAHIKEWKQADSEDVAIAWETKDFTSSQRRIFEASKSAYITFWGGGKAITNEIVIQFAKLAKE